MSRSRPLRLLLAGAADADQALVAAWIASLFFGHGLEGGGGAMVV